MSGEERKMKTYRIEVLFLEFGASGVEKMEAAGTSTRVVLEVLCHLGRMGVDEDGGRLKQGDARPPGTRTGGAERLCHLGKAGAGEDDGRLKQGGARSPGTRTGGAGRLCRLSKAGAGEDDGRLKQGGASSPGTRTGGVRSGSEDLLCVLLKMKSLVCTPLALG